MKMFKTYFKEELNSKYIAEGLISTYDTPKMVRDLGDKIGSKFVKIEIPNLPSELIKTKYGNVFTANISLSEPLNAEEKKHLDAVLSRYGYTNSLKFIDDLNLQLEPKYPVIVNKLIENIGDPVLYHITQEKLIANIMEEGLSPKTSQTTFDHPDTRIYFLWLPLMHPEDKKEVLATWAGVLAKNKRLDPANMRTISVDYDPKSVYYLDDTTLLLERGVFGVFTTTNARKERIHYEPLR